MSNRWNYLSLLGILLPAGTVIGLHIYIGSFSRLLADDFCSLYFGERLGLFRSVWYWYTNWHGSFSSTVADWFLSFVGAGVLPFVSLISLTAWVLITAAVAHKVLSFRGAPAIGFFTPLSLGVLLVFSTLALAPDIPQSLFWWAGIRGYVFPLISLTLYVTFCYKFMSSSWNRSQFYLWLVLSFVLAFFTEGFSETFASAQFILLAGAAAYVLWTRTFDAKDALFLFLLAGTLGALCALMAMIFAPGNSIRQENFPAPPDVFTLLKISFTSFLAFLQKIFSDPVMTCGLLGSMLGAAWLGFKTDRDSGITAPNIWWLPGFIVIGLSLALSCLVPSVYGLWGVPFARVLIVPVFFVAAGFLIAGFIFGEHLGRRVRDSFIMPLALLIISSALLIFASWNIGSHLYGMRGEYVSFARQWDSVDAQIKAAKTSGERTVHIPSMKNWAGVEHPKAGAKFWVNVCYSQYYDINVLAPDIP